MDAIAVQNRHFERRACSGARRSRVDQNSSLFFFLPHRQLRYFWPILMFCFCVAAAAAGRPGRPARLFLPDVHKKTAILALQESPRLQNGDIIGTVQRQGSSPAFTSLNLIPAHGGGVVNNRSRFSTSKMSYGKNRENLQP